MGRRRAVVEANDSTRPARGPPQTALAMGPGRPEHDEAAQKSLPGGLDQTSESDPAAPEPMPGDHFDQSWGE